MSDLLTIDVDATRLIAALDRLGAAAEKHVKAAAKVTAENVAREARARARRDSGETAETVTVEEAQNGTGYVVLPWDFTRASRMPHLPIWLERGTKHMTAKPYFFASARLEAGAHDRRMRQAIVGAIEEAGLGE